MTNTVEETEVDPEDFLQSSMEFEAWLINMQASTMFLGKSLIDWSAELSIPTVSSDSEMTVTEVELLHNRTINSIEIVMTNLAIAKSAFLAAKSSHEIAMIRCRKAIMDHNTLEGKKNPSNESLEKLCLLRCMKTYLIFSMSEVIHDFWNIQSFKLSRLSERLTSINYIKHK